MSKSTSNPPPLLFSIARKSSTANDESSDDDRAFLLPSNSSSFNLADDAEVINSSRTHRKGGKKTRKTKQHRSRESFGSNASYNSGQQSDLDDCSQAAGEISLHSVPSKDSVRDGSKSINTIHSGKSYNESHRSKRSGRSTKRQLKAKRVEKRREWMKRHKRRRLVGSICLTVVYSMLFFYTMIITIGPLALHFWVDITEWCPYYYDESWAGAVHDAYFMDIDQTSIVRDDTIKGMNFDMLQRTSNDIHQHYHQGKNDDEGEAGSKTYDNPDYDNSICHTSRLPSLFYLTLEECDLSRRMAASILFGGFIGYERRASDRPAGIRTMALVALGSSFFTISSQLAFRDSPMTWDSSRVSAAIPSGVGFLGAGLIWKGSLSDGNGGEVHQVHGITTAASVWLAAAVGVGAGGALYAVTAYSTALITIVLRFGPRLYFQNDNGFDDDDDESEHNEDGSVDPSVNSAGRDEQTMRTKLTSPNTTRVELNDTTKKYGATDTEVGLHLETMGLLEQETTYNHQDRTESAHVSSRTDGPCKDNKFFSWLIKLIPTKVRQPMNPYQEHISDRDIKRLIMRRKTMKKSKSHVSFCT